VGVSDLDNDGDNDILIAQRDERLAWLENLGGGEFEEIKSISSDDGNTRAVSTLDVNGDGVQEILGD
jgi:hypothetical protein